MSIRLYVGNLPKDDVERQDLQAVFAEAGDFVSTKVIKDRKTGKCRGFGFVTVDTDEQADEIIEKFNGYMFKDAALKIEKALPRSKGKGDEESPAPASSTSSNVSSPIRANSGGGNSGGGNSGGGNSGGGGSSSSRRGNKKSRRPASTTSSTSSGNSEGFQPDPRWADELAKLKEMLAAQASNS
jgi:RNA recognition motif-containing protein